MPHDASTERAQEQGRTTATRDPWPENAKIVAIVLVVVGHFIGPLRSSSAVALALSNFIYWFHMPLFVMLAGWFAGRISASPERLRSTWWKLLLPYLLFETINTGIHASMNGVAFRPSYDLPSFGMWFLVSLATWRLAIPWARKNHLGVAIAVLATLIVGYFDTVGPALSLSRSFFFFPAFLIGATYSSQLTDLLKQRHVRIASIAIVCGALGASLLGWEPAARAWFLGSAAYSAIDVSPPMAPVWRLIALTTGVVLALSALSIVTTRPTRLTALGRYTLYAYLLHLPLLRIAKNLQVFPASIDPVLLSITVLAAIALALMLMTKPVRILTGWLVDPATVRDRLISSPLRRAASPR